MATTIFATVLRASEVSLHILVQKGACMSFPCFTVGLSRFTVWMKVKRPSYVLTMNGAIVRFSPFCLFCLEYGYDNNRKNQYNSSQMNHIGIIANQNMI